MHRNILGDFQALQPTFINLVPRIFKIVMGIFNDMVKRAVQAGQPEDEAHPTTVHHFCSPDRPFGARLVSMGAGLAPITP